MIRACSLILCLFVSIAQGIQIPWLALHVGITCDGTHPARVHNLYFAGEVHNSQTRVAGFRSDTAFERGGRNLTARELTSLEWMQDKRGNLWIQRLELGPETGAWLTYAVHHYCPKARSVLSTPRFEFESEGLRLGVWVSYSNREKLIYQDEKGNTHEATIRIMQQQHQEFWP